jgi:hypothetical protein
MELNRLKVVLVEKNRIVQDRLFGSDFDQEIKRIEGKRDGSNY